jgi:hypothetical protein
MAALPTSLRTNLGTANYVGLLDLQKNNHPYEFSRLLVKRSRQKTQNIFFQDGGRKN